MVRVFSPVGTPQVLWMLRGKAPGELRMGTRLKTGRAPEAVLTDGCWDFDLGRFAVADIHGFHHDQCQIFA